jgi:hypothetical protein
MIRSTPSLVTLLLAVLLSAAATAASPPDRWRLAREKADIHRLFL